MKKTLITLITAGIIGLTPQVTNANQIKYPTKQDNQQSELSHKFEDFGYGYSGRPETAELLLEIEELNAKFYRKAEDNGGFYVEPIRGPAEFYSKFGNSPCSLKTLKIVDQNNDKMIEYEEAMNERYELERLIGKEEFQKQ